MELSRKNGLILIFSVIIVVSISYAVLFERGRKKAVVLKPENDGDDVTVERGTKAVIKLPENPSTGYEWEFDPEKEFADLLENKYIPPENQVPGRGGTRKIMLRITDEGTFLTEYVAPTGKRIGKRFSITFKVGQR